MPVKYVPYTPTPIEGQAILNNFTRTKRKLLYRGNDGVYEKILRGMPYYELEKVEHVGSNETENLVIHGECISTCAYLKDKGIKVDLVYIDPPFASGADYAKKIYIRKNPLVAKAIKEAEKKLDNTSASEFEEKMYGDIWDKEKFLNWMYENLMAIKSIMSEDASIYMHLDWHIGHYVKILMDEIFGEHNFRNEIVWHYQTYQGQVKEYFPRKHDTIFLYANSSTPCFHLLKDDNAEDTIDFTRWNAYLNENNEITGANYPKTDSRFDGYYKRFVETYGKEPGPNDVILKIEGNTVDSVWDIKAVDPKNKTEKVDYATQKPRELLERIINASSDENMIVADFFGGSGVAAVVANKLKRKFITCDVGINSIQTIRDALICEKASFDIYEIKDGVNLFRNPVQTMNKLEKLIGGLQIDKSLPKFWSGYFSDTKLGKIPVYIQDLKDSSSKIFDITKLNEIINEQIPSLEGSCKKVVVYYVDLSDIDELNEYINNNNFTGVEIEFRDLKSILSLTFEDDYLEYEIIDESSSVFDSKQLKIKKFISDRLNQKINEFNDKALAQTISNPENAKTIKLSNEGLEGIELVSVDCTSDDGIWHADSEIKVEKDNTVTVNGNKSDEGWNGTVPLDKDPLRIKVRNILGDETIIKI